LLSVIQVFGEYQIWLAAENGMYLRHTSGEWPPTMEHLNMDWKESVQVEVVADLCIGLSRNSVGIDSSVVTVWTTCWSLLLPRRK